MTHPTETWFTSLISLEILFQLPFFFYAVYSILINTTTTTYYGPYFTPLCIVYGAPTATTLIPILASVIWSNDEDENDTMTIGEKGILLSFYLPYLIFPLWLMILGVREVAGAAASLLDEGSVGMKKKKK